MARSLRALERGLPLPLASVHNRRSFMFFGNLADLLERCIHHEGAVNRTFVVSDAPAVSTADLVRSIARHANRPARLVPVPVTMLSAAARAADLLRPGRNGDSYTATLERVIGSFVVESSAVRSALGWHELYSLDEGIAATVAVPPTPS
jgi:UDP-glucose 4-epimerase